MNQPSKRGRFITLEGVDGAGKSTHVAPIAELLEAAGHSVLLTREPGGTALGETLRTLLLAEPMDIRTEALLMFAQRQEHLAKVIAPALAAGRWVLCDRFSDASFAYQGGGGGLAWEKLEALENWVHDGLQPDLTFFFDVPPEVARARLSGARAPDKFEKQGAEYFQRVRAAYLRRLASEPSRFYRVDGTQSVGDIQRELQNVVSGLPSLFNN